MDKCPLILFSGGLDSTALVYRRLQEGPCDVMYADGGQSVFKIQAELKARRKIIEYLNTVCPYKVRQDYRIDQHVSLASSPDLRYSQPAAWLFIALMIADPSKHSSVQVGYVYDDGGFCRWLPNIERAWVELQSFSRWGGPIPLEFPLIDIPKVQLLAAIDPELINMIWVCEQPKYDEPTKQCGKCGPCRKALAVLAEYKETYGHTIYSKLLTTRVARANAGDDWEERDMRYAGHTASAKTHMEKRMKNMCDIQATPSRVIPSSNDDLTEFEA